MNGKSPVSATGLEVTNVIVLPTATVLAPLALGLCGVLVRDKELQPVTGVPLIFNVPVHVPTTVPKFFKEFIVKAYGAYSMRVMV